MDAEDDKYITGKGGEQRLKGVSLSVPVVTGTIAFWMGKKATEYASHKWTVYLRSPSGEDLTHVLKRVVFRLHESFPNPERVVEFPPYELTEVGWGEFDVGVRLHFHDDAADPPLELYHRLKLYDETGANNAKRPVVTEAYDEVVFWQPAEAFARRLAAHAPRAAPDSQLAPYYLACAPGAEYARVQRARAKVASIAASVRAQAAALEAALGGGAPGGAGGGLAAEGEASASAALPALAAAPPGAAAGGGMPAG